MTRSLPWLALAVWLCACDSPRPDADRPARLVPTISFEPDCAPDEVPAVVRIQVAAAGAALPEDASLFSGALGTRDLRDLAAGRASESLLARSIQTLAWAADDRRVLAPTVRLEEGQRYSVAIPSWSWSASFSVKASDDLPYLRRAWPPPDAPSNGTVAVWCLSEPAVGSVERVYSSGRLFPAAVDGTFVTGAIGAVGAGCVRWFTDAMEVPVPIVAPPLLGLEDGRMARVDPSPIGGAKAAASTVGQCSAPSVEFGPVCAMVQDDRVRLEHDSSAWWLGVRVDALRWAGLVGPGHPAVLRPLAVDSVVEFSVQGLDGDGAQHDWWLQLRTKPAMGHLVLNEMMANPTGPEPAQEWVELFNDGVGPVQLNHWILQDSGGVTDLPERVLDPGQFAILVNSSYDPNSWVDRPPAPAALVLRVEKLGTDGLSNSGEPVRIVTRDGDGASSIPSIASPKQGVSVARRAPDLPDSSPGSFSLCPGGGTPGAPNGD